MTIRAPTLHESYRVVQLMDQSLRGVDDPIHPNTDGYGVLSGLTQTSVTAKGWEHV